MLNLGLKNHPMDDGRTDAYLVQVMGIIEAHGWAVQGVFPTAEDPGATFTYTVGLTAKGLPELLVYGLNPQVATNLLNMAAQWMIDNERAFATGEPYTGFLAGDYVVRFIDATTGDLAVARRLYPEVRCLQMVWPDRDGRFPWDDGYAIRPDLQPIRRQ